MQVKISPIGMRTGSSKGSFGIRVSRVYTLGNPAKDRHSLSLSVPRTVAYQKVAVRIGEYQSMLCFLCGKKIGFLRSLTDQQYCCAAHRQESRLASAQALRDEEDHEIWAVSKLNSNKKKPAKAASGSNQTASIFAFLIVAALLVAALMMPGQGPGVAFPAVSLDPGVKRGLIERTGSTLSELVRSSGATTSQSRLQLRAGGRLDLGQPEEFRPHRRST